jgi:CheY-like chemotaxis protein
MADSAFETSRRVMIVDDNVDCANSLALLVRLWGHDAITAHDGRRAVELARSYRPNMIFLDLSLPGLDGYEVSRQLRQEPSFEGTLLVALTGFGGEQARQRSRLAGFDLHLVKPVEVEVLQNLINGQLIPT